MVKDALGDRMKKYEFVSRTYLTPSKPVKVISHDFMTRNDIEMFKQWKER